MNTFLPAFFPTMKRWEMLMLKAYPDRDGSWHIGYGHGNAAGVPPFVDEHTVLKDEAEAHAILVADLEYLHPIVSKMFNVEVNDFQFTACMDVAYNRGPGRLRDSAVMHFINTPGEYHMEKAARAFVFPEPGFVDLNTAQDRITHVVGERLGLTLRRIDDAAFFLRKEA